MAEATATETKTEEQENVFTRGEEETDETPKGGLDDITAQVETKEWAFSDGEGKDGSYLQEPLSFAAKLEFFGLLGRTLDQITSGPDGASLSSIMSAIPGDPGKMSPKEMMESLRDNFMAVDSFVSAFMKLAGYSPELAYEAYCIWLRVPRNERVWLIELWNRTPSKGGLSDPDGFEILKTFIVQNYGDIEDFFGEYARQLMATWTATRAKHRNGGSPH